MIKEIALNVPKEKLSEFCRKWQIKELSLFGSVLTENFSNDSDIDVLVSFSAGAEHTLFDLVRMEEELNRIFGRKVDLVSRRGIESSRNYVRRDAILKTAESIYVT